MLVFSFLPPSEHQKQKFKKDIWGSQSSSPGILVCTGETVQASLYLPHFHELPSLGFKQMKQNSLPQRQRMCLQARTCSISMPQFKHERREGQPTTPTMALRGQLRRILRRLSSPEQSEFPRKQTVK